jgi:hypothetical protein
MRVPVVIQIQPFDIEKIQSRIDTTREAFVRYLDEVPRKSTRSKHGLMGPVGKILNEVRSGRRDPTSLKGYAVRVHEATGRNPSPVALDYGLYYDLRKRAVESREARRQAWIAFLQNKYKNEADLSEAWKEDIVSFGDLFLPRKAEGSKAKKATVRQHDIAAFWESQGAVFAEEEEE